LQRFVWEFLFVGLRGQRCASRWQSFVFGGAAPNLGIGALPLLVCLRWRLALAALRLALASLQIWTSAIAACVGQLEGFFVCLFLSRLFVWLSPCKRFICLFVCLFVHELSLFVS
jgi:hypothetical protein